MKRPIISAVVLIFLIILILSFNFLINNQLSGMEIARFPMKVLITEQAKVIGFDINTSVLAFGRMSAGGSGMRPLHFRNNGNTTKCIRHYSEGAMGKWLSLSNASFLLMPYSSVEVKAFLNAPRGIAPGEYSGEVTFFAKQTDLPVPSSGSNTSC